MANSILIVEDDISIRGYIERLLMEQGLNVYSVGEGIAALKMVEKVQPSLVLLDLGLPDMSGESVCVEIRKKSPDTSIIMLTGKDTTKDIVNGLNSGADDYITKPFDAEELVARIQAKLRSESSGQSTLQVDDLTLDKNTLEVKRKNVEIKLTKQEFKLLEYMMVNKERVVSRDMILNRIWTYSPDIETRVVDVYVGYLRKKIDSGFKKKLIHSVRGFGYVIKE